MKRKAELPFLLSHKGKYMRDYISNPDLGDNKIQACYRLPGSISFLYNSIKHLPSHPIYISRYIDPWPKAKRIV